jgi:hypothetical protein
MKRRGGEAADSLYRIEAASGGGHIYTDTSQGKPMTFSHAAALVDNVKVA